MSFGSRRFLTAGGRFTESTIIDFQGTVDKCDTIGISDPNGNTLLGTGSFNTSNHQVTNAGGGNVNAPMVVTLTPGRVYTIAILKDHSGSIDQHTPQVETNVITDTASITLRYGNLAAGQPPFTDQNTHFTLELDEHEIGSGEPELTGPNDGSGNPTQPAFFRFDNAPFVNDKIIVAEGLSVDNTHSEFTSTSNSTRKGLYVKFNVAQSSNGGSGRMRVSVTEGYF